MSATILDSKEFCRNVGLTNFDTPTREEGRKQLLSGQIAFTVIAI
ncbi:MAG: hypothetical protein WAM14_17720 [Candidatus Nitrosopolaris sp.]